MSDFHDMNPIITHTDARAFPLSDALRLPPGVSKNRQGASHRRPGAMINEQGFLHQSGRVRVKKQVQDSSLRLATWNIGTLSGKGMELVDTMLRRKVNIACVQETKWVGEKAREIENTGFKIFYTGKHRHRNGVGIVVDKNLKNDIVTVIRRGDRLILVKLVLGENIINIISAYAPQVGLDEFTKVQFWEQMDELIQEIPASEKIYIGGDFNGHVGEDRLGYEMVHGGYGIGNRNDLGESILDFAMAYGLVLVNTYFKKRFKHLITFKSGTNKSQIDFFITRKGDRLTCKDCKVIPGESLTTQHRIMVMDIKIKKQYRARKEKINP